MAARTVGYIQHRTGNYLSIDKHNPVIGILDFEGKVVFKSKQDRNLNNNHRLNYMWPLVMKSGSWHHSRMM